MNRHISRTLVVSMTCLAILALCEVGAGAVRLELKLEKGKTYYQKTMMDQKITQTIMDQQQTIEQSIGNGLKLDVLEVDGQGNMRIQYTYLWSRFKSTNPMLQQDYDSSRKGPVPSGAEGFAALIGQGYLMEMSPAGKVLKIEGVKELRAAVLQKLPAGAEAAPTMQVLNSFLDERSIKEMTEASMAIYPGKPVETGDSWEEKAALSVGFPMLAESKWTLRERAGGLATIAEVSSVQSNPDAPPIDAGGMKMKADLTGTQEGVLLVDEKTGLITSNKARQSIKGALKLGASAEGPFDLMTIPIVFETAAVAEAGDQMWKTPSE